MEKISDAIKNLVVGWDNRSSSFWLRSSDHLDHFGKHQSGIYMPQGPEFIRCDYPNPLPRIWWWAAIISTSQKQVSAATLESSKHDP
ncbi:hypothetical protein C2W62_09775 [Candidatus Entotheonella serta]|nr:hypothetical protein C2W62_09775 [Candidatus Entotheonella serta]